MDFVGLCACGDLAHRECLPKSESESVAKGGQYQCTPCIATEVFPGVVWSEPPAISREQMINTCTIDNFLTALGIFTEEQNADLEKFFPADEQHQNLRETLHLIRKKHFSFAQTKYYQECNEINDRFSALPSTEAQEKSINEFNKHHKEVMKKHAAIKSRNAMILEHNKKNPHASKELEATERIPELRVLNLPIPELLPKNNLWGEVFLRVHDKHPAGFEVGMQSSCSNPDCTQHLEAISFAPL